MRQKVSLLIPVENQVRELDPKLLLAYIAARRGFPSVIGPRRFLHFRIPFFPTGIYLSKSITAASAWIFKIMRKLGHKIVAWDEEALVHLPAEIYYRRRLSPEAMAYVSHLFAWGQDNGDLWRQYPELPRGASIHITGNPRSDLLRPELRGFYQKDVDKLRETYGDFILVNTNFNHVNAFSPVQNLFQPVNKAGEEPIFGRAARGMTREYAGGLRDHKEAVFEDFKKLFPALDRAFPNYTIVVRPHPTENHDIYHQIAGRCQRLRVSNEGNVVPWLMATKVLIHNGCTTGLEAYAMGVPAVTYRASVNEDYDFGFYRLPNLLSHPCFNFEELRTTLEKILSGQMGVVVDHERKELMDHYLAAQEGPFACERMLDTIEKMVEGEGLPKPSFKDRLAGRSMAAFRTVVKKSKSYLPGSHNKPEFQRHRYPGTSLEDVRERLSRFQQILGDPDQVRVEQISDQFFRIG
jgi:surface carbohydrate biosynthesis protein